MKILEAKKTKRGYYFKIYVNNKKPNEEPIYEEFRWGKGGDVPNNPDDLLAEVKRQLSAKYKVEPTSNLPQKGKIL